MGKGAEVLVTLRLRDEMGAAAKKALDAVTSAAKGVSKGAASAGQMARQLGAVRDATGRVSRGGREVTEQFKGAGRAAGDLARQVDKASRSEERLDREAKKSKRDIDETAKAGSRLAAALAKAGSAGKAAWSAIRGIGQVGSGLAGAAAATGMALKRPVTFEKRLSLMANTAYADRDVAGRIAGKKELENSINAAVRQGGGDRDQAAEALDTMLASGAIKADAANKLLPTIQKFATASGADSSEIAEIVIRGIQQKFFTENQAGAALDKAMAAGQAGGFELKDMAKWLPKMMAMGSGMKSMAGFEQILAYSQAAAVTAGSKDEAGNNLVNLLQKLNSQDTQKDFARLGIDLTGTLMKARKDGLLPLEAFGRLVEKEVAGKDPRYKAMQNRLASAKGDEKKQILGDMADLASSSAIGKVVQDRQALLALIAAINQKDYIKDVLDQVHNAHGTGEKAYQVYQSSAAYSVERAGNEQDIARSAMLSDVSGPLKSLAESAADLAQRFPRLATFVTEAATAFGAFSAGLLTMGGFRLLTGGAKGTWKWLTRGAKGAGEAATAGETAATVAAGETAATGAGEAAAAATAGESAAVGASEAAAKTSGGILARTAKGLAGLGRFAAKAAPWLTAGMAAWDVYNTESNDSLSRSQKNAQHTETAGGLAGALAGAKLGAIGGAAIGSVVPGLGTAVGGVVGSLAGAVGGYFGGDWLGKKLGQSIFGDQPDGSGQAAAASRSGGGSAARQPGAGFWDDFQAGRRPQPFALSPETKAGARELAQPKQETIKIESVLHLDGREIARAVNTYNKTESLRD